MLHCIPAASGFRRSRHLGCCIAAPPPSSFAGRSPRVLHCSHTAGGFRGSKHLTCYNAAPSPTSTRVVFQLRRRQDLCSASSFIAPDVVVVTGATAPQPSWTEHAPPASSVLPVFCSSSRGTAGTRAQAGMRPLRPSWSPPVAASGAVRWQRRRRFPTTAVQRVLLGHGGSKRMAMARVGCWCARWLVCGAVYRWMEEKRIRTEPHVKEEIRERKGKP